MPTAGRPEGEVNRTSFHYQWLLLSCFRSPPDPMPTAGRPEGEFNLTSFHYQWLLLSCCTPMVSAHPRPHADGRPEGEERTSFHYQWSIYYCLASPADGRQA
ncbi:MAG: hypothetical protein IPP04_22160 [Saprospiraceae bacterium]|nr:hypothetical protein [Saprospiraceae bacterium]